MSSKSKYLKNALISRLLMEYLYCDGFCAQENLIKEFKINEFCIENNIKNHCQKTVNIYFEWICNNGYKVYDDGITVYIKKES